MSTRKEKTAAELFMAQALAKQLKQELTGNILPYWTNRMQNPERGFYGRIDGHDTLDENAPKGAIMNARLLWTFASAYRLMKESDGAKTYLEMAQRAKREIIDLFYDADFGGMRKLFGLLCSRSRIGADFFVDKRC